MKILGQIHIVQREDGKVIGRFNGQDRNQFNAMMETFKQDMLEQLREQEKNPSPIVEAQEIPNLKGGNGVLDN